MINKQVLIILIIVLFLCLPFLLGVFEANVGPQGNSVGTAQLRTATGSFTQSCASSAQFTGNDYAFGPGLTDNCSGGRGNISSKSVADPGDTIFAGNANGGTGSGNFVIRWRYMTTTDAPYWWVCISTATGVIISAWISDDPPTPTFTGSPVTHLTALGQPDPLVTCRRVQSSDLQALNLSAASYTLADAWIRSHGLSPVNRQFRALQHAAGSLSPSGFMVNNLKIVLGQLVPMTVLPTPVNGGLP